MRERFIGKIFTALLHSSKDVSIYFNPHDAGFFSSCRGSKGRSAKYAQNSNRLLEKSSEPWTWMLWRTWFGCRRIQKAGSYRGRCRVWLSAGVTVAGGPPCSQIPSFKLSSDLRIIFPRMSKKLPWLAWSKNIKLARRLI